MISILIVTKDRVEVLKELVDSLVSHASDLSNLEFIFGVDYDDRVTLDFVNDLNLPDKRIYTFEPNERINERGKEGQFLINRHRDFINPMAFLSKGEYIWILNDDVRIHTKGFDEIIPRHLDAFLADKSAPFVLSGGHESILPMCDVGQKFWPEGCSPFSDDRYFCYPIINRYTLNELGFFIPPEIASDAGDIILANIFKTSVVDRIIRVPVLVEDSRYEKTGTTDSKSHTNGYMRQHLMRDVSKIDAKVSELRDFGNTRSSLKCSAQVECGRCNLQNEIPNTDIYRSALPRHIFCKKCLNRIFITPNVQRDVMDAWQMNHRIEMFRRHLKDTDEEMKNK